MASLDAFVWSKGNLLSMLLLAIVHSSSLFQLLIFTRVFKMLMFWIELGSIYNFIFTFLQAPTQTHPNRAKLA